MEFDNDRKNNCPVNSLASYNEQAFSNDEDGGIHTLKPKFQETGGIAPYLHRSIADITDEATALGEWNAEIISDHIRSSYDEIFGLLNGFGFSKDVDASDAELVLNFKEALVRAGADVNVSRSQNTEQNGHITPRMNADEYEKHKEKKQIAQTLAVGKNVSGGIFGALGYGALGDVGSYAGAIVDQGMGGLKSANASVVSPAAGSKTRPNTGGKSQSPKAKAKNKRKAASKARKKTRSRSKK